MKEKIARKIVEVVFIIRYWVVIILMLLLAWLTYYIYRLPNTDIKDVVSVFTGGSVLITVFYLVMNYEYNQRKFKHDIKSSRDLLSFNTALEWQREYMVKNQNLARNFYLKYKHLLDDGKLRKFQAQLDRDENEDSYSALLCVLNFLESICLGVKQGIMDEDFIRGFFGTLFILYYTRYVSYINFRRREKQNNKIWNNFTTLSEKWLNCP